MALDPIEMNIAGVQSLVGSKLNKTSGGINENQEGVSGELINELTLDLTDEELLDLKNKTENKYSGYEAKLLIRQQANKAYYLGKQKTGSPYATDGVVVSDNLIFEATETLVPASLAKNPEPVVYSDDTAEGNELSDSVKTMLQYHTEVLGIRSLLNITVRRWTLDFLGCIKIGWDSKVNDITLDVRDVKNMVFDPDGFINQQCDYVGLLGERIKSTAQELVDLFPEHKAYITVMVDGKMGTDVIRTEWWNDEYTFTTYKEKVLDKSKNPNFNYDKKIKEIDIDGAEVENTEEGNNHFARPKKPYQFLSVYTFGDHPHDETGLIEQNIPNQRRITNRTDQIDFNLSRQNNSDVFSAENFNQEEAVQAKNGLAKGNPILVPKGRPIEEAIVRMQAQGLDGSFFNDLANQKTALRMSFGTEGITAQAPKEDTTARGMILNSEHDSSRISGGIGDAIERLAKAVFNQMTQFYYVYYDEPHEASIMGQMKAVEYTILSSAQMNKKLVVTVSPDSMKPRDELTEMNQSLSLWEAGALDPKTLLTRVNVPDPTSTAEQTVLWLLDKNAYFQMNFPELAQKLQGIQQQQMAQAQNQTPSPEDGGQISSTLEPSPSASPASAALSNVPLPT